MISKSSTAGGQVHIHVLRDVNGLEGKTGQTAIDHSIIKLENGRHLKKVLKSKLIHSQLELEHNPIQGILEAHNQSLGTVFVLSLDRTHPQENCTGFLSSRESWKESIIIP